MLILKKYFFHIPLCQQLSGGEKNCLLCGQQWDRFSRRDSIFHVPPAEPYTTSVNLSPITDWLEQPAVSNRRSSVISVPSHFSCMATESIDYACELMILILFMWCCACKKSSFLSPVVGGLNYWKDFIGVFTVWLLKALQQEIWKLLGVLSLLLSYFLIVLTCCKAKGAQAGIRRNIQLWLRVYRLKNILGPAQVGIVLWFRSTDLNVWSLGRHNHCRLILNVRVHVVGI